MSTSNNFNRRNFLKSSIAGASMLGLSGLGNKVYGENSALQPETAKPTVYKTDGSVFNLACPPMDVVRIGIVGLGMRGPGAVTRLSRIPGTEIKALCDIRGNMVDKAQKILKDAGRPAADGYGYDKEDDWKKVCERTDIDLVYFCTPWELHVPNAVYAMQCGKHAAIEVPGALTIDQCYQLVTTAEKTKRHCMMLENCCYDFFELATLNMARQGVFGEVIHAECAYIHNLRDLMFNKSTGYYNMWRLKYNQMHTGNPYPTHGLGPVCQIMNINRGDKFEFLTSVSTNQFGMTLYARDKFGENSPEATTPYKRGDMNTTLIRTNLGHTIMVQHNVTSPRPYNRIHLISGTKGVAEKYPEPRFAIEPESEEWMSPEKVKETLEKYKHPLEAKIGEEAKKVGGHGGMDYMMDWRLIYCLRNGLPLDQNVYDAATWSSLVELSEQSVLQGGKPMAVPDFTAGVWKTAKPFEMME